MITESLNFPKIVVLWILKEDFGSQRKSCACFVPHLSNGKIESHLAKTLSRWPMQTKFILNKIITGDVTWCFAYVRETHRWSSEWLGETFPPPKKLKFQRSRIKTILIIFFSEISRRGTQRIRSGWGKKTVNAELYKRVMDRLLKRIQWVRPARSAVEVFSCCTIIRPFTKL